MGLKKRLRAARARFHSTVTLAAQPTVQKLGRRLRLRARIRLINRWGAANPKTAVAVFAAVMAANIAVGIAISPGSAAEPDLGGIMSVSGMTRGSRQLDAVASQTRDCIEAISADAERSRSVLDSLLALPVMTEADSVRVAAEYNKLSTYAKLLSNEQD